MPVSGQRDDRLATAILRCLEDGVPSHSAMVVRCLLRTTLFHCFLPLTYEVNGWMRCPRSPKWSETVTETQSTCEKTNRYVLSSPLFRL